MSLFVKKQREAREARLKGESVELSPGARVLGKMPQGPVAANQAARLLEIALEEDLKTLSGLRSVERKEALKRDVLLPKYREHVADLMQRGKEHNLIIYYLIWCFDAGDIPTALLVAEWCLAHKLNMPERFKADLPFFVADQTLAWAKGEYKAGRSFEPYLSNVLTGIEEQGWDIADTCKAGFYALLGRAALVCEDYADAISRLARADELGGKVQTDLERAKKLFSKAEAETNLGPEAENINPPDAS